MSALVYIHDSESFCTYMDVLNGENYCGISPPINTSKSNSLYAIYNEKFGWIRDIHLDLISEELKVGFTKDRNRALGIEGSVLNGRILTWGACILL